MELPTHSIIASGPVIIENGKVLLNREQKSEGVSPWMFPGGEVEDFDASLEDACRREVREEMGIDIEILRPLSPIMLHQGGRVIILIHYLAKRIGEIKSGEENIEWGWHDMHNLPSDTAPNVPHVIAEFL